MSAPMVVSTTPMSNVAPVQHTSPVAPLHRNHYGGRILIAFLAALLLAIALVRIGVAAFLENRRLNGDSNFGLIESQLIIITLLSGVLSFVTAVAIFIHIRHWNTISRFGATSILLVDWALALLALGYSAKYFDTSIDGEQYTRRKELIAVLNIISCFITLLLLIFVNTLNREYSLISEYDLIAVRTMPMGADMRKSTNCSWCNRPFGNDEQFCGSCGSVRSVTRTV